MTHSITYLPKVDLVITMQNGEVSEVGTYDQLIKNDGAFAEFIRTYLTEKRNDSDDDAECKNSSFILYISLLYYYQQYNQYYVCIL